LLHCQTKRIRAERSVRSKRITCEEQSMHTTLVGVFENRLAAERAREELLRAGFADDEIDLRTGADDRGWRVADDRRAYEDETQSTVGETVADWFRSLFGLDDDEDVGIYTEAVRRGDSVVTVHTGDQDRVDRAADILEACGSIDIDEQANEWQQQGWARPSASDAAGASRTPPAAPLGATAASAAAMGAASARDAGETGGSARRAMPDSRTTRAAPSTTSNADAMRAGAEELRDGESRTIPVIEERLRVGKRIVGRRRMRVYTRMVDEPVQENVRLTDERVQVEHRNADRPATGDDYRAAQGKSIEVTEGSEEPVVAKDARVVGEVEIGKRKSEHEETVRSTVRRSDVEVRELGETDRTDDRPKGRRKPGDPGPTDGTR